MPGFDGASTLPSRQLPPLPLNGASPPRTDTPVLPFPRSQLQSPAAVTPAVSRGHADVGSGARTHHGAIRDSHWQSPSQYARGSRLADDPTSPISDRDLEGREPYRPKGWPQKLPPPHLLLDLIDAFFDNHVLAPRILHRAKFMRVIKTRLELSSANHGADSFSYSRSTALLTDDDLPPMPSTALLHAICAFGIAFAALSTLEELFPRSLPDLQDAKLKSEVASKFSIEHCDNAKLLANDDVVHSRRLLECVQTAVILGWYNVRA